MPLQSGASPGATKQQTEDKWKSALRSFLEHLPNRERKMLWGQASSYPRVKHAAH